jgi:3-phosphoshikimate 1-carboxyvinyltransferase
MTRPVEAVVHVPGSKSIANRALVCAALADGSSVLTNVPGGDDTVAMIDCLRALGLAVVDEADRVTVAGSARHWPAGTARLHAALAGTTSRFVTALAALGDEPITIDGHPPLRRRPFAPLHDALAGLGVEVRAAGGWGSLPVTVCGPPTGWHVAIAGDVSSQYISALMLIAPYLPGGLGLELSSRLVSRPYVEMTAAIMAGFGAQGIAVTERSVTVERGRYAPISMAIEPDASSASYPMAMAAVRGGSIEIAGLGRDSLQGDACFADLLEAMGCEVEHTHSGTRVTRRGGELSGIDVDLADASDLVPTLAAVALFAATPTTIRGVGFIRNKESDRLGDLAGGLRAAGGDVTETSDGLVIGPSAGRLHAARLATHHDHRLAMAFAVVGSGVDGIEVDDPDVVSKSWPGFSDVFEELRR